MELQSHISSPLRALPVPDQTVIFNLSTGEASGSKPSISVSNTFTHSHEITTDGAEQKAFEAFQRCCPQLTNEHAEEAFQRLRSLQLTLEPSMLELLEASDTCPYSFAVTNVALYVLNNIAGKGTSTTVFFATRIGTVHGTPEKLKVLKRSKKPYDGDRILMELSPASQKDGERSEAIDHPDEHYFSSSNSNTTEFFAIADASKCNLSEVDYKNIEEPVSYIVPRLKTYIEGLGALHRSGIIHCDIKGGNLLVSPAKVTDFGLAVKQKAQITYTAVTPFYAAPFIWEKVLRQVTRKGMQTPAADIFAFGRTIQYDVLQRILKQLGEKYGVPIKPIIAKMMPKNYAHSSFEGMQRSLVRLEAANPGCVIYEGQKDSKFCVRVFPKRQEIFRATIDGIALLNEHLPEQEIIRLKRLAGLAFDLQNSDPATLPSYKGVISQLRGMVSSAKKRRLFEEVEEEKNEAAQPDPIDAAQKESQASRRSTQSTQPTSPQVSSEELDSSPERKKQRTFA